MLLNHPLSDRSKRRFHQRVSIADSDDACWLWTGPKHDTGYGVLSVNGHNVYAHRMSYRLANGPFPAALFVLHRCDVKLCVNPHHLFLGDNSANMLDAARKGRLTTIYERGEAHPKARLTEADVKLIRHLYDSHLATLRSLSDRYSVSLGCIGGIVYRHTWRHVA